MTADALFTPSAQPPHAAQGDARPPRKALVHTGRLILTTTDPHASPDLDLLVEGLNIAGFLGERWGEPEEQRFLIGPYFLSLLAFSGCAVRVRGEPEAGERFSHIRVPPPSAHPELLSGRNTRPPRCLGCRERLADWRERTAYWATHPHAGITCPNCGETRPPWLWDWKQQGGFGRVFIAIEEVFPGEATPTPSLFDLLIRVSGAGWRHFYVQDEMGEHQPPASGQP